MRDFGGGGRKTPGKASFNGCSKTTPGEWVIFTSSWSLYLVLRLRVPNRRALTRTFGLPVSKTESLIWGNDIFTRLHHRRMVHRGTSISTRPKGDWVSRLSQRVLRSVCNTPLWVTLSKSLKPDNLILLYGHVFVFHSHWRGRFSRAMMGKNKITP